MPTLSQGRCCSPACQTKTTITMQQLQAHILGGLRYMRELDTAYILHCQIGIPMAAEEIEEVTYNFLRKKRGCRRQRLSNSIISQKIKRDGRWVKHGLRYFRRNVGIGFREVVLWLPIMDKELFK